MTAPEIITTKSGLTATLYLADCLTVLPTLGKVDAVITDPPYCSGGVAEASRTAAKGQGLRSENLSRFGWFVGDNMGTAGLCFLLREVAAHGARLCGPSGSLLFFCDWRMLSALQPAIESAGVRSQGLVVWDKGSMGLGTGFRCQHELVMHFTTGAPEYHDKGTGNVITTRRVSGGDREHQTQKPWELLRDLAQVVAPKGGTILDPFMGSGTTGVAALRMGCSFIGIEIERKYYEIAKRRIAAEAAQGKMF
jgi:DNA modification methylase